MRYVVDCNDCVALVLATRPYLWEACASVGDEHGKPAGEMLRLCLADFHDRGHPDSQLSEGTRPT